MGRKTSIAAAGAMLAAAMMLGCAGGGDGGEEPGPYVLVGDRLCAAAEPKIAALDRRRSAADPRPLARDLFWLVGRLRVELGKLHPDEARVVAYVEMEEALFDFEVELIDLFDLPTAARARNGTGPLATQSARVQRSAAAAGLRRCAELSLWQKPALRRET